MSTLAESFENPPALNQVTVPDLWQQQAVAALREGRDVVVQAPTGSGKTLIFELWSNLGRNRGQAIYTVPTRALANDKLAEWRARGWNVGIATGDLADNLDAPIIVATLETQKNRLIRGDGPALLVVDEYQMIGDQDRGLNYELALALAPPQTQLLLLSGSVANPQDIVKWFQRLGRRAELIRYEHRPVPLEDVEADHLNWHLPGEIRGYWPRLVAKSLAEDLGPVLVFAPRRKATEMLAAELARQLPCPNPLQLTLEQKQLVGEHLAKMLRSRVAYHHSGLSYAARAGVIEPLAKAGALRVVVATMGLAAGINFSLRSVALAGDSYRREAVEQPLKADEILQMFGRAGRRGIDETGYVLISDNGIRLRDGRPAHLARSGMVDWNALLGLMSAAAEAGRDPFAEAVRVQQRLFTTKPVVLGVEESLKNPVTPCGLKTDAERARHVRKLVHQMLNSRGEWEPLPEPRDVPLRDVRVMEPLSEAALMLLKLQNKSVSEYSVSDIGHSTLPQSVVAVEVDRAPLLPLPATQERGEGWGEGQPQTYAPPHPGPLLPSGEEREKTPGLSRSPITLHSALTVPDALEKTGHGLLAVLSEDATGQKIYGRSQTIAEVLNDDRVLLVKWVRRLTNWNGRQSTLAVWNEKIRPLVEKTLAQQHTPVVRWETADRKITALLSVADLPARVFVDAHGVALWKPVEREVAPPDCARCELVPICRSLALAAGVALLWRRLGLIDAVGVPTRRGRVMSFLSQGDGLSVASALEDERYPLDEMIYDLANLNAGFRFCGEENRWAGRLAMTSQRAYGVQSIPGYLENGVPTDYGSGAEQIVAALHKNPLSKSSWVTEFLGAGDIDRVIIEWRSTLRQIAHAPALEWPRWLALQAMAKGILHETESPTRTELPPLDYTQTKRVDHRLTFRRH